MPEVLGNPPSPRAVLFWNGTAWQWALVDAAGHLQLDVVTSGLPAGAATAAAQALALAQLQLIEDMRDALQSVATDRLQVRGEDQLFSFKGVLALHSTDVLADDDGSLDSPAVPAGEIWVVTTVVVCDSTSPCASIVVANFHDGAGFEIEREVKAFAIGERKNWGGHTYLDPSDTIRVTFYGGKAGDTCHVWITGFRMTLET